MTSVTFFFIFIPILGIILLSINFILGIAKDKCSSILELTLHNTPKPHAFTSLPLQSKVPYNAPGPQEEVDPEEIDPQNDPEDDSNDESDAPNIDDTERSYLHEKQLEKYENLREIADKADRGEPLTDKDREDWAEGDQDIDGESGHLGEPSSTNLQAAIDFSNEIVANGGRLDENFLLPIMGITFLEIPVIRWLFLFFAFYKTESYSMWKLVFTYYIKSNVDKVALVLSNYLAILKDKGALILEWTLHNTPKPHGFNSSLIECSINRQLYLAAYRKDPKDRTEFDKELLEAVERLKNKPLIELNDEELKIFKPMTGEIGPGGPICAPENHDVMPSALVGTVCHVGNCRKNIMLLYCKTCWVSICEQCRDIKSLSFLLITNFAILDIPFITVMFRAVIYVFISLIDTSLLPLLTLYLEPLLQIRKGVKYFKFIIKLGIYIKNNNTTILKYLISIFSFILLMIFGYLSYNSLLCDAPRGWGLYFQDGPSSLKEALYMLYSNIVFYHVPFLFSLCWIWDVVIKKYKKSNSPISIRYLHNYTLREWILTIISTLILVLIAFPSFKLLYLMDEVTDPSLSVLAEGYLRHWSYEYLDFLDSDGGFVEFDSHLVPESDIVYKSTNNQGNNNSQGNTFSGPNDNVIDCEHRSRHRTTMADCSDFKDNPVDCSICGDLALDGTPLKQAVVCTSCGATICESCNDPNSDSDNDSGLG